MKIVIIGNGKIGSNLAALLVQEGHDITVVDCDETHLRKSQNTLDVMCIEGNGATAETQLEAGADKATLLIAATPASGWARKRPFPACVCRSITSRCT